MLQRSRYLQWRPDQIRQGRARGDTGRGNYTTSWCTLHTILEKRRYLARGSPQSRIDWVVLKTRGAWERGSSWPTISLAVMATLLSGGVSAEEIVTCADGSTQSFANGPPFCAHHGGATGLARREALSGEGGWKTSTRTPASSRVVCADGATQSFSVGPPYCIDHGGISGAIRGNMPSLEANMRPFQGTTATERVACADGTSQSLSNGPPFCTNHGGSKGIVGQMGLPSQGAVTAYRPPMAPPSEPGDSKPSSFSWADLVVGVLIIGAAAAIIQGDTGGHNGAYSSIVDYSWRWDLFRDQYGYRQWACRGMQTGQFAEEYKCASQLKADFTWPGE